MRGVPGPWPLWLFGSLMQLQTVGWANLAAQYSKKYGSVFKVRVQPLHSLDSLLSKAVLNSGSTH